MVEKNVLNKYFSTMNENDRKNLRFLLTANQETFVNWFMSASEEDIIYAAMLFEQFRKEFENFLILMSDPEIDSLEESRAILSKFN